MKKLKLAKTVIGTVFFLFVLIVGSFVFLSGKKDINGWRFLVVKSGSMEPTIKTGSLIFIKQKEEYQESDIVTYGPVTRPDFLVTHRIVDEISEGEEKYFVTKGDFNEKEDVEKVYSQEVIGKYQFGIPYFGYVINFAKTRAGVILLVVIPGTLIVYEEFKNIKNYISGLFSKIKEKKAKQDQ